MKSSYLIAIILGYLVFMALVSLADITSHRPIELQVTPRYCLAPCEVRATVRIEPHPLNRWYVLQIDGPMLMSESRSLEGDQVHATQEPVWFKELPEGEYQLVAVVYRQQAHSEAGRAIAAVSVIGPSRDR